MGNELHRIMNVTSDRKTFVLNNNFDDIKNSEYIDKIILDWECASFTNELDGEKKINCSIALDQFMAFLDFSDFTYNVASIPIDFGVNIFKICVNVYKALPLSDYNYQEIYDEFSKIMTDTLSIHDLKHYMENYDDKDIACIEYISKRIIEEIKNK